MKNYDVIISGAGPVGLFLACELALAKCSVLVLEKTKESDSPLKRVPFGIRGLSAPSIEALQRRGLLDQLKLHKKMKSPHSSSGHGSQRQVGHFAGLPLLEGNINTSRWSHRLPSSPATSLISEIEELETIFSSRAKSLGVEILRGHPVTDFQQTHEGVTVHSEAHAFQSQWLVGCDGGRSFVRKNAGFEFAGTEPEFTGYTALVDIADPEKLKAGRNVTPQGMYMQSQPGYIIVQDFDGGAFHAAGEAVTRGHFQEVLRRISSTDVTVTALHVSTTWTDRARQATTYRKGRVFLAGDAAHIHSPLGGQGLNLGLGDAMNLGWKLAMTIHSKSPEGLLDTYQTERHPIGVQILDWSRAQVAAMRPDPHARALSAVIRDLLNSQDGATYMAGRIWGVFTKYDLASSHPLVGMSAPNFELQTSGTLNDLMTDGQGIFLDLNNKPSLKSLTDNYGVKYACGKTQLGSKALIIRPDGIIAWATDEEIKDENAKTELAKWFVKG